MNPFTYAFRRAQGDEAENSIMQTISIAVSAILIAAGLVTAPSLINNARDVNAKTDLANIALAQAYAMTFGDQYYENLMKDEDNSLFDAAQRSGLTAAANNPSPGVKYTTSNGVYLHAKVCRLPDGSYQYLAKADSTSGKTFYRSSESTFTATDPYDPRLLSKVGDNCIDDPEKVVEPLIISKPHTGTAPIPGDGSGDGSDGTNPGTGTGGDTGTTPGDGSGTGTQPGGGSGGDTGPVNDPSTPGNMILTWNTKFCPTVRLPIGGPLSGTVDWGDGQTTTLTGLPQHTYGGAGQSTNTIIKVSGKFATFGVPNDTGSSAPCMTGVTKWENTGTTSAAYAFSNMDWLTTVPDSIPSTITDMSHMFEYTDKFVGGGIKNWYTGNVTKTEWMFYGAKVFNEDLSGWNTAKLTSTQQMFADAAVFNGALNGWNTSALTNASGMFLRATAFNQPLGSWNTAKLTNATSMFSGAHAFNQPLNSWNVSSLEVTVQMFYNAWAFNQPLNNWNTTSLSNAQETFYMASQFDQDISSWNVSRVAPLNPQTFVAGTRLILLGHTSYIPKFTS